MQSKDIARAILIMYEDMKSLNSQALNDPEVKEVLIWVKNILRGPCPHCCNGTIIINNSSDTDRIEYGLCPHCQGDSRQ